MPNFTIYAIAYSIDYIYDKCNNTSKIKQIEEGNPPMTDEVSWSLDIFFFAGINCNANLRN